MVEMNLRDNNILENLKAINELRRTGMFTDEELQEMYDKQVEADKRKVIQMNEYIKRENVMQTLQKANIGGYITERLLEIPSEDVQPVVRCKDCKHRKERHYEESGEKPYIKYECKFTKYSMSDEGFCSFGAKKDGDSE